MDTGQILKRPYARLVTPDSDGSFLAEILEFPGCFAVGKTAGEALENLEGVAVDWLDATIEQGQDIPEPMDSASHSGKLVLRMPKGLHKRSAMWADRDGVSLNSFIVTCIAEHVGERAASRRPIVLHTAPQYQNVNLVVFNGPTPVMANWSHGELARPIATTQMVQLATSHWGQYARS